MKKYVITAAGGNATAIGVIQEAQTRSWYESTGKELEIEFAELDVEQIGFIALSDNHFEMSGGELCGNGSRAAGLLFAKLLEKPDGHTFTASGHEGKMSVDIKNIGSKTPHVTGVFPNLDAVAEPIKISGIDKAQIVDLGGIVHVIVYGKMPTTREAYETEHNRISEELGLEERLAVGVDWIRVKDQEVAMDPVVGVRSAGGTGTFFYETSCGSGSISVAVATGISQILQPSGEHIIVDKRGGAMTIASKMEVTHGRF